MEHIKVIAFGTYDRRGGRWMGSLKRERRKNRVMGKIPVLPLQTSSCVISLSLPPARARGDLADLPSTASVSSSSRAVEFAFLHEQA